MDEDEDEVTIAMKMEVEQCRIQNPRFGFSNMKTGQCNYLISGGDLGQMLVTLILMATILLQNMQICSKDPNWWWWASGDNPFPLPTPHPCM